MVNMSYCMHQNTAADMEHVIESWDDFNPKTASMNEIQGRQRIIEMSLRIAQAALDQKLVNDDLDPESLHDEAFKNLELESEF